MHCSELLLVSIAVANLDLPRMIQHDSTKKPETIVIVNCFKGKISHRVVQVVLCQRDSHMVCGARHGSILLLAMCIVVPQ